MSEELKPCSGCGHSGELLPVSLMGWNGDPLDPLFGCLHCGIYTRTESTWNALPREPEPLVWSSERPKVVGRFWARFADIELRPVQPMWTVDADKAYLDLTRFDQTPSNCEFAGPIPVPVERRKEPARRGFTLIELLVVMAIISMLIVIAGAALVGVTTDMRLTTGAKIAMDQLVKAHALALSSGGSGIRLVPDNADSLARLADGTLDPTQTLTYSRIVPLTQPLPYKTGLASINTSGWPAGFTPAYGRLVLEESLADADGHRAEPTSWWWAVRVGDTLEILDRKYTVVGPMLIGPGDGNPTCHVNWGPRDTAVSPLTRLDPVTGKTMPVQWLYLADRVDDDRDGLTDEGWDGIDNDLDQYGPNGPDGKPTGLVDNDAEQELDQWQGGAVFGCTATRYSITPRLVQATAGGALLPASVMIDATSWKGIWVQDPDHPEDPEAKILKPAQRSHLPVDPFTGEVDLVFNAGGACDSPSIYGRPANRPLNEGYLHLWVSGVKDVASPPLATGEGRLVTLDLRTGRTTSGYADAADVGGTIATAEGEGR